MGFHGRGSHGAEGAHSALTSADLLAAAFPSSFSAPAITFMVPGRTTGDGARAFPPPRARGSGVTEREPEGRPAQGGPVRHRERQARPAQPPGGSSPPTGGVLQAQRREDLPGFRIAVCLHLRDPQETPSFTPKTGAGPRWRIARHLPGGDGETPGRPRPGRPPFSLGPHAARTRGTCISSTAQTAPPAPPRTPPTPAKPRAALTPLGASPSPSLGRGKPVGSKGRGLPMCIPTRPVSGSHQFLFFPKK